MDILVVNKALNDIFLEVFTKCYLLGKYSNLLAGFKKKSVFKLAFSYIRERIFCKIVSRKQTFDYIYV